VLDLSVIVVNYNAGGFLEQCLGSIRRVAGGAMPEVLVVDNASSDGSLDAVAGFPEVRLIRNERNLGFARAANQGIEASTRRYLLLLNPDTVVGPGTLEILVAFADAHRDAAVVGPRLLNPDGSLQPSAYRFPTLFQAAGAVFALKRIVPVRLLRARLGGWLGRYFGQLDPHARVRVVDYVTGACMLIRREVVTQIGGFDPRFFLYFEDKDFCWRVRRAGWGVYFTPAVEVVHHLGQSSRTVPGPALIERFRSMRRFYEKHYRPPACLALRGVLLVGGAIRLAAAVLTGNRLGAQVWGAVLGLALGAEARPAAG